MLSELTPGAVATTRYGKRKRSKPTFLNMFLNRLIICRASMSCISEGEKHWIIWLNKTNSKVVTNLSHIVAHFKDGSLPKDRAK